jgi:hypothetical protein
MTYSFVRVDKPTVNKKMKRNYWEFEQIRLRIKVREIKSMKTKQNSLNNNNITIKLSVSKFNQTKTTI